MEQLTILFEETSSSATSVADVIKKSALTSQAFQILNYLDFFEYDAVGYPNYCDYEDFERYTNTLCCQGTFDYERKDIADDAAYELLSAVAEIPEKERKLFLEYTTDWYQHYKNWCENNNIKPITYNDFDWGYRKLYMSKIFQRKDFTEQ